MNLQEEDVFLIVLARSLDVAENKNRSFTDIALACVDATKEIMSVTGKMSKTDMGPFGEYDA